MKSPLLDNLKESPKNYGESSSPLHQMLKNGAAAKPSISINLFLDQDDDDDDGPLELPDIRQNDDYSCGAAAAMSTGRYYGVGPATLGEWKKALGTSVQDSTRPDAIVKYLKSLGLQVDAGDNRTIDDLKKYRKQGSPCIVCCQDYGPQVSPKAKVAYGHYLVCLGTYGKYLCFQDSSEDNVLKGSGSDAAPGKVLIDAQRFYDKLWKDEDVDHKKYNRYGICVGPKR